MGASVLMGGGAGQGFEKSHRMGCSAPPPPPPTIENPDRYGNLLFSSTLEHVQKSVTILNQNGMINF